MRDLLLVVVVVVVGAAACTGGGTEVVTVTVGGSVPESAASSPSTSSEPAHLSRAAYQRKLDTISRRLIRNLERLQGAPTYAALVERSARATDVAMEIADSAARLHPPPNAVAVHDDLVASLVLLARGLATTGDAVGAQSLCAAPAVTQRLGSLDAVPGLASARRSLAKAGFKFPTMIRRSPAQVDRSLASGLDLVERRDSGTGELKVENGRVVDGVVALVPHGEDQPIAAVYVRAATTEPITNIPDGTYDVFFTYGRDWDPSGRFTRKCGFTRFDEVLEFETIQRDNGYTYSVWSISLQPVQGGQARTSPINPDLFPSLG